VMAVFTAGLPPARVAACCIRGSQASNTAHSCCGSGMACCKVRQPAAPAPLAPLAPSSHPSLLKAMPALVRGLVLYRISFVNHPVRISRGAFPPPPLAPLAQGCIQLI
jgi:hypothetical protein